MSPIPRLLPICMAAAITLLPLRVQADPVLIMGGFLVSEGLGSTAEFQISGDGLTASGLTGEGFVGANFTCFPCTAGDTIRLDALFVDRFGRPQIAIDGVPLEDVGLAGVLAFEARTAVAPSAEMDFLVQAPFRFRGTLAAYLDPLREPTEFLFERTLIGRGTLTASFGPSARHPDDPVLFVFRSIRYDFEPIPEPATLLLVGTGVAGAAFRWRKRRA